MVRVTGFEPAASCSQSRRATNCATPGYEVVGWPGRILPKLARYQLRNTRIYTPLNRPENYTIMLPKLQPFLRCVFRRSVVLSTAECEAYANEKETEPDTEDRALRPSSGELAAGAARQLAGHVRRVLRAARGAGLRQGPLHLRHGRARAAGAVRRDRKGPRRACCSHGARGGARPRQPALYSARRRGDRRILRPRRGEPHIYKLPRPLAEEKAV